MDIKRIVAGIDFSEESELAAREGMNLARHTGAELVLVHVGEIQARARSRSPIVHEWEAIAHAQQEHARRRLGELHEQMTGQGVDVSQVLVDDFPPDGLCKAAMELDAQLVITGTHGLTGIKRFFLGSVAERTVRLCGCDVMVVRPGSPRQGGFEKILVPTDFSAHARAALRRALELAAPGAEIELVNFWQVPVVPGGGLGISESVLADLRSEQRANSFREGNLLLSDYRTERFQLSFHDLNGDAVHGIIDRATVDGPYDAIVIGSHGRRGFRRFLLGSVAESVVRHAPCTVLVAHHEDDPD